MARLRHSPSSDSNGLDINFPSKTKSRDQWRKLGDLAPIIRVASSKTAARTLKISPRTVEFHRANIIQKLCARNIVELMRLALGDL